MQQYKDKIKELEECAVPTYPPAVREQREKDATTAVENIAQNIHRVAKHLEKRG
jgi:hypothetical protein